MFSFFQKSNFSTLTISISILRNLGPSWGTRLSHVTGYSSCQIGSHFDRTAIFTACATQSVYCHFCNCTLASANRRGHVTSPKDEVVHCTRRRRHRRAGCTPPSPPGDSPLGSPAPACSRQNLQRLPAHRSPTGRSPATTLAGRNPDRSPRRKSRQRMKRRAAILGEKEGEKKLDAAMAEWCEPSHVRGMAARASQPIRPPVQILPKP
jgi:hypothetical protein